MRAKPAIRHLVDLLMLLILCFLMGYQLWGEVAHEWAGAGILVLFLAHNALNLRWYRALFRGQYPPLRAVQAGVNLLLAAAMAIQIYSGIVISRHVFGFLPIQGGMSLARRLHILGAYWGFLLSSVHLGLHWGMFLGMANRRFPARSPRRRNALLLALGVLVAAWGVVAFFRREFPTYLFLRSEFVFLDYEEPILRFYLDYFCLMGLGIFLGHFASKALRQKRPA